MSSGGNGGQTLRRAMVLMTASSVLVPAAGVLTQPILAHALGVDGRGALAAAIAPAALAVSVATFGLPDAMIYFLAKHPHLTRRALLGACSVTVAVGVVCLLVTAASASYLSAGDDALGRLIVLGMALTVPALVVGVFRGAATGRQMWGTVAGERFVNTAIRIVAFVPLWLTGQLTLVAAVLVSVLSPVVCGIVYWRLLLPPPTDPDEQVAPAGRVINHLLSFGSRVWLGAVAEMLLARIGQILMTPLAGVQQLGLYSVAVTIADLPLIVAIAIQGALFGVNSKTRDAGRLTATTRLTVLVTVLGCTTMALTLPFWIGPLFGEEFTASIVPTIMLMISATICIPGLMAAIGVSAWGRPGLRSIGLALTLIANLGVFLLLVPHLGAMGGAWTSLASNGFMTTFMVLSARRVMGVPASDFLVIRGRDVVRLWSETTRLSRSFGSRLSRVR